MALLAGAETPGRSLGPGATVSSAAAEAAGDCNRRFPGSPWFLAWKLMLALAGFLTACSLEAETSREYQIKAAFLFNFSQFTDWPPEAFPDKESPLVIGILSASDPFGGFLDETVKNEAVQGRKLVVKHYTRVAEIETCHILYIGQSESKRLDRIVDAVKGKPVLTVSDITDCASRGIMIGFVNERNKIRFKINAATARAASLSLSSKLLRAAEIVGPE
jgi:uncharacterized protein DUF4154